MFRNAICPSPILWLPQLFHNNNNNKRLYWSSKSFGTEAGNVKFLKICPQPYAGVSYRAGFQPLSLCFLDGGGIQGVGKMKSTPSSTNICYILRCQKSAKGKEMYFLTVCL